MVKAPLFRAKAYYYNPHEEKEPGYVYGEAFTWSYKHDSYYNEHLRQTFYYIGGPDNFIFRVGGKRVRGLTLQYSHSGKLEDFKDVFRESGGELFLNDGLFK